LSLLPSPPPPEPLLHEQATQGRVGDNDQGTIDTEKDNASPERPDASFPEDDGFDDDSEIDELLRALSESGSSEDDKDEDIEQPRPKAEGSRRKLKPFGSHGPTNNIALLMVACWTLRLPVMYMDFIRFDYHILCSFAGFSVEPVFQVDRILRSPLPGATAPSAPKHDPPPHEAQCAGAFTSGKEFILLHVSESDQKRGLPQHAPSTLILHSLSARLARRLLGSYRIHTPELNAAPMLWRVVRALGGSRE
jgi:RNA polymerase I-specific transcription initiation factor RRN7